MEAVKYTSCWKYLTRTLSSIPAVSVCESSVAVFSGQLASFVGFLKIVSFLMWSFLLLACWSYISSTGGNSHQWKEDLDLSGCWQRSRVEWMFCQKWVILQGTDNIYLAFTCTYEALLDTLDGSQTRKKTSEETVQQQLM